MKRIKFGIFHSALATKDDHHDLMLPIIKNDKYYWMHTSDV